MDRECVQCVSRRGPCVVRCEPIGYRAFTRLSVLVVHIVVTLETVGQTKPPEMASRPYLAIRSCCLAS